MTSIKVENGLLSYTKHSGGSKVLLAFHGFGQDNKIFDDWIAALEEEYSVYAFDLYYHGSSIRPYKILTKSEWKTDLSSFLTKEDISEFTIVGFSLGGRFAISSALSFPDRTKDLILIAPDGIYLSIWFKLVTKPYSRWLFKYMMLNPNKLEGLIAFNEKYRLVSPYIGDFVRKEMGDAENRKRVYISWNYFKTLGYSKRELFRLFNKYSFPRRIILGSKDHVIKPDKILPLIDKMGDFKIDIIPKKHHQLIKPEVAKLIVQNP